MKKIDNYVKNKYIMKKSKEFVVKNNNSCSPVSIYLCGYDFEVGSEFVSREHRHSFFQLNLVSSGHAVMETKKGRRNVTSGDAILVPPGELHCLWPEKDFCDCSFKFFINRKLEQTPESVIFTEPELREQQLVWIRALEEIFRSIAPPELFNTTKEFPLGAELPGVELLEELVWGFCRRIISSGISEEPWIIRKIKLLVQSRRGVPLTVNECAEKFNCSAEHLLTLVRKETGMTTKEVIDRERIRIAKGFLAYSDISISDLALRMCFNDLIYFDKFFRKYTGESPREYRKRHKIITNEQVK